MYLKMSRKGVDLAFLSRRTRVISKFQNTIVRFLKVPPFRLVLRVLKMLYFMYSIDPQISQSHNSWMNLICSSKVMLCQVVKIFSLVILIFIWIRHLDTWTLKLCDTLEQISFTQLVNTPTHIQSHILDALCWRDSFSWAISPKVIGGLSDHQAIMFGLIFPVRESCQFQHVSIRKIHKIRF